MPRAHAARRAAVLPLTSSARSARARCGRSDSAVAVSGHGGVRDILRAAARGSELSPRRAGSRCASAPSSRLPFQADLRAYGALEAQQAPDQRNIQIGACGQEHQQIARACGAPRAPRAPRRGTRPLPGRSATKCSAQASIEARGSPPITARIAAISAARDRLRRVRKRGARELAATAASGVPDGAQDNR